MQLPILDDLAGRVGPEITVAKVNVEAEPDLAQRFHIRNIPALVLFRDGGIVKKFLGVTSADVLEREIAAAETAS